jgi:hypothetical protein
VAGTDNRTDSAAQTSSAQGRSTSTTRTAEPQLQTDKLKQEQGQTTTATARAEEAQLLSNYAQDIQTTARMLQGAGVAIYPLDARFLSRNTATVADKSRMMDMAKSTGGLSFASPKDLSAAVHDAIRDSQTVYIARYAMPDSLFNGGDRALKIETRRKDVKLRARRVLRAPAG